MREIKFRAFQDDKMIHQERSGVYGTKAFLNRCYEDCELMQFTGLLDKNGKEIYEGDIVMDGSVGDKIWDGRAVVECPATGVVSCYNGAYNIADEKIGSATILASGSKSELYISRHDGAYSLSEFEIIGNIHETKNKL